VQNFLLSGKVYLGYAWVDRAAAIVFRRAYRKPVSRYARRSDFFKMKIFLFLFLNIYSFLLLALGAAVFFLSNETLLLIIKIVLIAYCAVGATGIMFSWRRKQRMIKVLLQRNRGGFNERAFAPYMETLCAQLVVLYVLFRTGHLRRFFGISRKYCFRGEKAFRGEEADGENGS
jgi:amino acid transporter